MDFRYSHRPMLIQSPDEVPNVPMPDNPDALDQWEMYLRRSVNLFYRCSAVCSIDVTSKGKQIWILHIQLCWGHNADWLCPHIPKLVERIEQIQAETGYKDASPKIEIKVIS